MKLEDTSFIYLCNITVKRQHCRAFRMPSTLNSLWDIPYNNHWNECPYCFFQLIILVSASNRGGASCCWNSTLWIEIRPCHTNLFVIKINPSPSHTMFRHYNTAVKPDCLLCSRGNVWLRLRKKSSSPWEKSEKQNKQIEERLRRSKEHVGEVRTCRNDNDKTKNGLKQVRSWCSRLKYPVGGEVSVLLFSITTSITKLNKYRFHVSY